MRLALIRKGSAKVELKVVEEKLADLEAVPAARRTKEQADAIADLHGQVCNLRREVASRGERYAHDLTPEALADFLWREGMVVINPDEVALATLLGTRWRGKEKIKLYLSGYLGENERIVRKTTGTTDIESPLCAIGISTQIKPLEEMVENAQERERGLFARFLINVPPDKRAARNPSRQIPVPDEVAREYERFMEFILRHPENRHDPILLQMRRYEFECFSVHLAECAVLGASESQVTMADWLAKMGSHLSRVAGILHVMLAF